MHSFFKLFVTSPTSQLILQPFRHFTYCTSQLILQPFRCFTYDTAHSSTLLSLLLRHRLFTYVTWRAAHEPNLLKENKHNLKYTAGKNAVILQSFRHFTYVTTHSPALPSLHLYHSSFSNPSIASPTSQLILQPFLSLPTSQLILQPFHCFTYVTAHSPTFFCFTYVTAHSPTFLSLLLRHRLFTYVSWRTAHATPKRGEIGFAAINRTFHRPYVFLVITLFFGTWVFFICRKFLVR